MKYVFPELRERCMKKGLYLVDVDLRWGVTQEEAEQGKALELCLEEIENCHPFFIGLLGERYGWIPESYQVPDYPRFDWIKNFEPGHSITALEIHQGVLRNHGMHTSAFFYFRDPAFGKDIPGKKRNDICSENAESSSKLQRLKSEIRRVFREYNLPGHITESYHCSYKGLKLNLALIKDEITGVGNSEDLTVVEKAVDENHILGKSAYEKLNDRQKRIIEKYSIVYLDGLETFGKQVLNEIWHSIEERYPDEELESDPLMIENRYHENFLQQRTRFFTGRKEIMDNIITYLEDHEARKPLFVKGESGCGKSALMSIIVKNYKEQNPGIYTLVRFVGASPDSQDIFQLVTDMIKQLETHFGIDHDPERITNHEKVWEYFSEVLWQIGKDNHLLLVIDAVNQLRHSLEPHYLGWLPKYLPEKVKFIVSTLDGDYTQRAEQLNLPIIQIKPLGKTEISDIIKSRLGEFRKKLSDEQMQLFQSKKEAGTPLYLAVACEELRTYPQFELILRRIADLPHHTPGLFEQMLERLEQDHGRQLVTDALCLIECSQHGLQEEELLELLARPGQEKLPANTWVRLYRDIALYLSNAGENKDGLVRFFHKQFSEAVKKRYLPDTETEEVYYHRLADYGMAIFEQKPEVVGNCLRYLGVYLYKNRNEQQIKELFIHIFDDAFYSFLIRTAIADNLFGFVTENFNPRKAFFLKQIIGWVSTNQASLSWTIFLVKQADNKKIKGFTTWALELYNLMNISFDRLSRDKINNESLVGFALSLHNLAEIYSIMGDSLKSLSFLKKSDDILNDIMLSHPLSVDYYRVSSVVCNSMGSIIKKISGNTNEALKYHTKAKELLKEVLSVQPHNIDLQRELAVAMNYTGDIYADIGDLASARLCFEEMHHLIERMQSAHSSNTQLLFDYMLSVNNLGNIFLNEGKVNEGLDFMLRAHEQIINTSYFLTFNTDFDQFFAETNLIIGNLFSVIGDNIKSIFYFRKACDLLDNLVKREPFRTDFQLGLATCFDNLGRSYLNSGDNKNALKAFQSSYEYTKKLITLESERFDFLFAYIIASVELGKINYDDNNKAEAQKYFEEINSFFSKNKNNLKENHRITEYYLLSLWYLSLLYPKKKGIKYIEKAYWFIRERENMCIENGEIQNIFYVVEKIFKKERRKSVLRIFYLIAFSFYITLFIYPIPNAKYSEAVLNLIFGMLHGFSFLSNWIISLFNPSRLTIIGNFNLIYNTAYIIGVSLFFMKLMKLTYHAYRRYFFKIRDNF